MSYIKAIGSKPLLFYTSALERMRVDTSGFIGINLGGSSPASVLEINSSASVTAGRGSILLKGTNNTERVEIISNSPVFQGYGIGGTIALPSASTSGLLLVSLGARGYGSTGYVHGARGFIGIYAAETWTDTANGTYITFTTTPTGATTSAERMRIDNAGNIGVGTISPTSLGGTWKTLEIKSNTANDGGILLASSNTIQTQIYSAEASGYGVIGTRTNHPLVFSVNNAEVARITSTGATSFNDAVTVKAPSGGTVLWLVGRSSDGLAQIAGRNNANTAFQQLLQLTSDGSYVFNSGASLTERMRLTGAGKLGLGTFPSYPFHIQGAFLGGDRTLAFLRNTDVSVSSAASLILSSGSDSGQEVYFGKYAPEYSNAVYSGFGAVEGGNSGIIISAYHASGIIKFLTAGTEKMRLDSSGNLGVGMSAASNSRFSVKAAGAAGSGYAFQYYNSSSSPLLALVDNGGLYAYALATGTGTTLVIDGSNQVVKSTSSIKYKENISDNTYGLETILKLATKKYNYKVSQQQDIGLLAEDIMHILPELVVFDNKGNPDAIRYDRLSVILIKALQELKYDLDNYKFTHP